MYNYGHVKNTWHIAIMDCKREIKSKLGEDIDDILVDLELVIIGNESVVKFTK
jgi:hypothetical protein